jgi:DNA-binding NtrC family response regulator
MPEPSHVLVVDDHPHMVAIVARWLVRAGYHVTSVTTVPEALEALTANPIAWVITDLILPTGSGMDILAHARRHQPEAKVIIMTAFGSEATRQRAVAHGAHAFLSKPFSGKALLDIFTQESHSETCQTPNDEAHLPASQ